MNNTNHYKKILVPIDGSKYSEKVLKHTSDLVRAFDSKVTLLYVIEKPLPINFLDRKEYLDILQKFGNKTLNEANDTLLQNGITAKLLLKKGNIVSEIEKVAKNEKYDLIIVGSKGLGMVTRFLLGSVSNKLAQYSPCSLLIVK